MKGAEILRIYDGTTHTVIRVDPEAASADIRALGIAMRTNNQLAVIFDVYNKRKQG